MKLTIKYDGRLTNQTIIDIADNMVADVINGEQQALAYYEQIKAAENILDAAKKRIEEMAMSEAQQFGKGESLPSRFGAKITYKDGSARYDFSNCITIVNAEQSLKEMKERAKKGLPVDGELLEKPIVSYTKPSLNFSF